MQALLAAQQNQASTTDASTTATKSRDSALKDLFSQLDGDGDGAISQTEFQDKLGAGGTNADNADKVFAKLDADSDGSISLDELSSALKGKGQQAQAGGGAGGGGSEESSGASSTSVTNADGSVTTSITYADGSTVSTTSAASASSASSKATSSYNFIEQLIQRQAAKLQASATSSVSVSA
jgi:hypothetical protein